jgi:hypothetical protein
MVSINIIQFLIILAVVLLISIGYKTVNIIFIYKKLMSITIGRFNLQEINEAVDFKVWILFCIFMVTWVIRFALLIMF